MRLLHVLAAVFSVASLLLALGIVAALRVPSPLPAPEQGFRFGRVSLVEPGGPRRASVSLDIVRGRIASIGAPAADPTDPFVDAVIVPALTDMHAHFPMLGLEGDPEYTSLLMLLHGVTRVRLLGGVEPDALRAYRTGIEAGDWPGPHYLNCGPFVDGPDPVLPGARVVTQAEEARLAVAELAAEGVDCIKAYDHLDLATATALRESAREHGLPIVGHTPQRVRFEDARFDDHQHLRGLHPPFQGERLDYPHFLGAWLRHDDARTEEVIRISLEHGIAHTPTLVAVDVTLQAETWNAWRETPAMQLWSPHSRDAVWSAEVGLNPVRFMGSEEFEMVREATRRMRRTVKALNDAGVPIHTGTDANAPNVVPGASLHGELRLLVEAGLTPEQALELSTRDSPRFLGFEGAGELRVGAPAEFIILRDDPTRDLAALDEILGVMQSGRLYRRAELIERLERYQAHYEGFAFDDLLMGSLRGVLAVTTGLIRGE